MLETLYPVLTIDLVWAIFITFAGGLMLGYTGWGGLMVSMPLMTFLYGPVDALAIVMFGATLVTLRLFPDAARKAEWRAMTPLLVAMVIGVPIGSWFLFHMEPEFTRRAIGFIILGMSLLVLTGWRYKGGRGTGPAAVTGLIAGLINGFVGLGGPPLVIYMLASGGSAAVQRANILIAMAVVSVAIMLTLFIGGGISLESTYRGLINAPPQWMGGVLGAWLFSKVPAEIFRKFSLVALVVLGVSVAFF